MTTEVLNNFIDNSNRMETICDDVLDILYYKYGRVPRRKHVKQELDLLSSMNTLLKADELFLISLRKAYTWFHKVPLNEYLELWCLDRHIPRYDKYTKG